MPFLTMSKQTLSNSVMGEVYCERLRMQEFQLTMDGFFKSQ